MKKILVCGAGGFIGGHLVKRLRLDGFWVRGVDLKEHEHCETHANEFIIGDLRDPVVVSRAISSDIDEVYQLAADMGGAGFVFTGENDADIMHNSALINLNVVHECVKKSVKRVFYSSSACMYPEYNQLDPDNPKCNEDSAYPAAPDSEYGWEKLFSERLYLAYARNYGLNVRIARYHNIFGPEGTWDGGREKAPAAMCRKAAMAMNGEYIEVWGDGKQTRSFLYIDECIEATRRLMDSDFTGPVNIGSEEMISINDFAQMAINISGKNLKICNIQGKEFEKKYGFKCPVGVRGRNSDNALIKSRLGWDYSQSLLAGMEKTYKWILQQVIHLNEKG
ncbi:MAG: NAD-dependent dehydratase [Flammeovirgaceae bacterium]|nr:NAD-dependent dehydratase [Flammeovirgaceae bacterium]|tara:strand:- start:790 stop:1797 length:1008 start_codon:yes stop_codon:yes gene_type:complete